MRKTHPYGGRNLTLRQAFDGWFQHERNEGEYLPPWYYGRTYRDWESGYQIYNIMPFNYFIRWGRFIQHLWAGFRRRESWIDEQTKEAYRKGIARAKEINGWLT